MKKTYIAPVVEATFADCCELIAESFGINSTTKVNGDAALTKGENAWDIWGDEAE